MRWFPMNGSVRPAQGFLKASDLVMAGDFLMVSHSA